jgi:ClpX C4-type zinc finger
VLLDFGDPSAASSSRSRPVDDARSGKCLQFLPHVSSSEPHRLSVTGPHTSPAAVLIGAYVAAYARPDDAVRFVQRNTLSVNGEWLGRVPCLAVCQDFETSEFMILHCDESWEPLGIAAGIASLEDAKKRIEKSYVGIGEHWKTVPESRAEAFALHQAELAAASCSFCGRTPSEIDLMFGSEAKICNLCVESFGRTLHSPADKT